MRTALQRYAPFWLSLIVGLMAWEIAGRNTSAAFMVPFSATVVRLWQLIAGGEFLGQLLESAKLFATGFAIAIVCFLGLTALLLAVIPLVAILPILLYIGLVIGAQAFQATPKSHAPAVVLALIPNIAEWAKTQIDGALAAAGTSAGQVGAAKLAATGVLYHGLESLGGGSVLAGMILGAIAVFIIDNRLRTAGAWAFAGAILAYVGLIHGSQLGWAVSPLVALGYVMFGATCFALGTRESSVAVAAQVREA